MALRERLPSGESAAEEDDIKIAHNDVCIRDADAGDCAQLAE